MDRITLSNMKFFSRHGCEDFEQRKGQVFEVDVVMLTDLEKPSVSDRLCDAVDYAEVHARIRSVMEQERHDLLEKVAGRIAEVVLQDPRIRAAIVRVRKPAVLLSGILDGVEVELHRGDFG